MRIYLTALCLWILTSPVYASFFDDLSQSAINRTSHFVIYDGNYQKIAYPNGDVAKHKGVCTDVVIRAYRALGIDLQQLVHEDMQANFDAYPNNWGLTKPDSNIDHRRVPNLRTFFRRHGVSLDISSVASDYKNGDIVTWRLDNNRPHIGIVVVPEGGDPAAPQVVHNIGWGPTLDDSLFDYKITGHYRFSQ